MKMVHTPLQNVFRQDLMFIHYGVMDKNQVLKVLVKKTCDVVDDLPYDSVLTAILERERSMSTAVGKGVAFPHCRLSELSSIVVSFALFPEGIEFSAPDNKPVYFLFLMAGPDNKSDDYIQLLSKVSRLMRKKSIRDILMNCHTPQEIYSCLSSLNN